MTTPPLIVHHLETSRSHRVLWLLEELGVPYELRTYRRDPKTRLAPPELKAIHPLGKSPVITHGSLVVAESGAILEYLGDTYADQAPPDLAQLVPAKGTPAYLRCRFWMHYAEGSLMNWLLMKLVFMSIPKQPMPFFVKPIARAICQQVQQKLIDPNLATALPFMDQELSRRPWFAGDHLTLADFQMSFAVEAALSRALAGSDYPALHGWLNKVRQRPAYQRAIQKGGPVIMAA